MDYDKWKYRHHLRGYFNRGIAIGLDTYLGYYGEYISDCAVDWDSRHPPSSANRVLSTVFELRRYTIETTVNIFRYIERNGKWPTHMAGLRDGWKELCEKSANHQADGVTRAFIRNYLDVAYIVYRLDRQKAGTWSSEVAHLKSDISDSSIVDEALSESCRKGMTPKFDTYMSELNQLQKPESTPQKVIREVTDDTQEYSEWIKSFQKEVQEKYKKFHAD